MRNNEWDEITVPVHWIVSVQINTHARWPFVNIARFPPESILRGIDYVISSTLLVTLVYIIDCYWLFFWLIVSELTTGGSINSADHPTIMIYGGHVFNDQFLQEWGTISIFQHNASCNSCSKRWNDNFQHKQSSTDVPRQSLINSHLSRCSRIHLGSLREQCGSHSYPANVWRHHHCHMTLASVTVPKLCELPKLHELVNSI